MAEGFGVEDRGHFYDPVGALRDVVVNHLMQVVAAAAMEPPAGDDPRDAQGRDRRRLPRHARRRPGPLRARPVRRLPSTSTGVAPDSTTETYAALRLDIDNWRWSGVPFFIRTGKRLPTTQTEVRLVFRQPPRLGFLPGARRAGPEPDQLVVKLDPSTGVRLLVEAQRGGRVTPEQIDARRWSSPTRAARARRPTRCCSLAAMRGDSARFTRQDGVEEKLADACSRCSTHRRRSHPYAKGSWGPAAGDGLVAGYGGWHGPWMAS